MTPFNLLMDKMQPVASGASATRIGLQLPFDLLTCASRCSVRFNGNEGGSLKTSAGQGGRYVQFEAMTGEFTVGSVHSCLVASKAKTAKEMDRKGRTSEWAGWPLIVARPLKCQSCASQDERRRRGQEPQEPEEAEKEGKRGQEPRVVCQKPRAEAAS